MLYFQLTNTVAVCLFAVAVFVSVRPGLLASTTVTTIVTTINEILT